MKFKPEKLKKYMKSVMQNSIEDKDAETVAEVFIRADMRGHARITRSKLKMSKTLEEDWVLDREGKPTTAAESGDLFAAINIDDFISICAFKSSVEKLVRDIHTDGCLLPGERRYIKEDKTR